MIKDYNILGIFRGFLGCKFGLSIIYRSQLENLVCWYLCQINSDINTLRKSNILLQSYWILINPIGYDLLTADHKISKLQICLPIDNARCILRLEMYKIYSSNFK